jgi:hypothetical protein
MSFRREILLPGLCVLAAGFLAWKGLIYRDHLRNVPEAMNVWWVRYAWEESSGFGLPGGYHTGIFVYDMPEVVKMELRENGLAWLNTLPRNSWQGMQGSYFAWRATPVPTTYSWADPAACPPTTSDRYMLAYPKGCPSISGLMDGYGLLPFDRDVEVMVNEALFAPGAYYAPGRWGILVLIPNRERIVYVF